LGLKIKATAIKRRKKKLGFESEKVENNRHVNVYNWQKQGKIFARCCAVKEGKEENSTEKLKSSSSQNYFQRRFRLQK
jgi:hypothetical protein